MLRFGDRAEKNMSKDRQCIILPQSATITAEAFAGHQLAWEFRCEREERRARQHYCQWYRKVSQQNRRESERLQQQQQFLKQGVLAFARALYVWRDRRD